MSSGRRPAYMHRDNWLRLLGVCMFRRHGIALMAILGGLTALPAAVPAAQSAPCAAHDLVRNADCKAAKLPRAHLVGRDLRGVDLTGADLVGANLAHADLVGAKLRGADLSGANLDHANLDQAELAGAVLDGARLDGTDFAFAKLTGAKFFGARLHHVNFDRADATGADFTKSHITTSRLIVAGFKLTIFDNATLNDVDLQSTDFHFAKFINADLQHNITIGRINQHFGHTNFRGASFLGAKFTGVTLDEGGTHIREAIDCRTVLPNGSYDDLNC
jgi:uncharacterized protein YjbI with pentapeptide repeats